MKRYLVDHGNEVVKATEGESQRFIFFWRPDDPHGFLSNWSFHALKENHLIFKTAEHYLMYYKALTMGDGDVARRILESGNPREARSLGKSVKNWDEEKWEREREKIMFQALWLKASQHADVKRQLLATEGKIIAEASPYDAIWGIGLSSQDKKALDVKNWVGKNLLGKTWMKVREILLNNE